MILDTRTLFIVSLVLTFVMGIGLLITARKDFPQIVQKSMRVWGIAYLILALGWLMVGLRGL